MELIGLEPLGYGIKRRQASEGEIRQAEKVKQISIKTSGGAPGFSPLFISCI